MILDITEINVSTNAVSFVKIHVNVITFLEFVMKDVYMVGMETIVYSVSYTNKYIFKNYKIHLNS